MTAVGRNLVIPRVAPRQLLLVAGVAFLTLPTLLYLANLPRSIPVMGQIGDWHYLGLVDPAQPYADNGFYRWAPIAAYLWHGLALIGIWPWTALHFAALLAFRDWRATLLGLASWPFWLDLQNGSLIVFVVLAAWWALRGSRIGVVAYVALFALMPRPLMVPVLAWLVWHRTDARWALAASGGLVAASSLALGQLGPWLTRLASTGGPEVGSAFNLAPSAFIGLWWLPIGLPLAAYLAWKGRLGLASLAASPYWLGYYVLFSLLELHRDVEVVGRQAAPDRTVHHAKGKIGNRHAVGPRAEGLVPRPAAEAHVAGPRP